MSDFIGSMSVLLEAANSSGHKWAPSVFDFAFADILSDEEVDKEDHPFPSE